MDHSSHKPKHLGIYEILLWIAILMAVAALFYYLGLQFGGWLGSLR